MVYDIILIYLGRISSPIYRKQAYLLFIAHVVFSTGHFHENPKAKSLSRDLKISSTAKTRCFKRHPFV